jgi:hypothetical protein
MVLHSLESMKSECEWLARMVSRPYNSECLGLIKLTPEFLAAINKIQVHLIFFDALFLVFGFG